jgi:hypothetical protein
MHHLPINYFLAKGEVLYPYLGAFESAWSGHDVSALRLGGGDPWHDESNSKAAFYRLEANSSTHQVFCRHFFN